MAGLEDRLKAVEEDIRGWKTKQKKRQYHPRFDDEPEDEPRQRDGSHMHARNLDSEEVEVNSDGLQDSFGAENAADGMGAMVFSAEEDCGFFGRSWGFLF